jgi:hypothetical protein
MNLPNHNTIFFTLSAPFFKNSKGQLGKKVWIIALFFIGSIFMFIYITQIIPVLKSYIPSGFMGWFSFFTVCMMFFFFYAVYKSL